MRIWELVVIASLIGWTILGVLFPGTTRLGAAFIRDGWSIRSTTSKEHIRIVHMQPGGAINWKKGTRISPTIRQFILGQTFWIKISDTLWI